MMRSWRGEHVTKRQGADRADDVKDPLEERMKNPKLAEEPRSSILNSVAVLEIKVMNTPQHEL